MKNLSNTSETPRTVAYDRAYKWLHWSMAFLVMLMLFAVFGFAGDMSAEERMAMLTGHSSIGTLISVLLVLRLSKRFIRRDPRPTQNTPLWQQRAAKTVQLGLYFSIVFVPLTGYLTARFHALPVKVFGSFDISASAHSNFDQTAFSLLRQAHEFGTKLIMVLLVLHIGAAFYHRLIKKDAVLASMTSAKNAQPAE